MSIAAQVNPPINAAVAAFDTFELNTQAYQAQRAGNLEEAERLFLHTIELKERHSGPNSVTVATSRGMLGEVYLKMGKIEEAEYNLKKAMEVMSQTGASSFNTAITRENLAQLAEMKGDMGEAKALRLGGAPNVMACANSECTRQGLRINVLKQCSNCKSVYYCSEACQRVDWRGRHKKMMNSDRLDCKQNGVVHRTAIAFTHQ
ncbi:MUB1/samB family protein [Pleurotus pulmonarius]